jgi:FMN phosphatase YigB (HAD superfamily)
VPPGEAATVDDTEKCLDWARRAGMRTLLMAPAGTASKHEVITTLSALVSVLATP